MTLTGKADIFSVDIVLDHLPNPAGEARARRTVAAYAKDDTDRELLIEALGLDEDGSVAAIRRVAYFLQAWQQLYPDNDLIYSLWINKEDESRDLTFTDLLTVLRWVT